MSDCLDSKFTNAQGLDWLSTKDVILHLAPETGETRQSHLLFLVIWANIQGTQHGVDDGYQQYCQRINSTQPGTNRRRDRYRGLAQSARHRSTERPATDSGATADRHQQPAQPGQ